jgi:hypothetical protein
LANLKAHRSYNFIVIKFRILQHKVPNKKTKENKGKRKEKKGKEKEEK